MPCQNILTLNAGSSSIKFALFSSSGNYQADAILDGTIERLGSTPFAQVRTSEGTILHEERLPGAWGPRECSKWILGWMGARNMRYDAVSHRVVHGGNRYRFPVRINTSVIEELEELAELAPLHQPHNLEGIKAILELSPDTAQVACFDTAYHSTQESTVRKYALPAALANEGVLAYGFHGLSYEYVSRLPLVREHARNVVLHLGSGASACAIRDGRSIATSMGFTALDGLVMGTRCGALDPGVLLHLLKKGMTVSDLEVLLYRKSGMKGLCGYADMRDVVRAMDAGDNSATGDCS